MLRDKNMRDDVRDLLQELEPREAEILKARYGLDGGRQRTLEEVGKNLKVTRERVRQLQNIALGKLRRLMEKQDKPLPQFMLEE